MKMYLIDKSGKVSPVDVGEPDFYIKSNDWKVLNQDKDFIKSLLKEANASVIILGIIQNSEWKAEYRVKLPSRLGLIGGHLIES